MGFTELSSPAKQAVGTGVKLSIGERGGLTVSLSGPALDAMGGYGDDGQPIKALIDLHPTVWQIRLLPAKDGRFKWSKPPISKGTHTRPVRLGKINGIKSGVELKAAMATWEATESGQDGIDIDLPRELLPSQQPAANPAMVANRRVGA